VNNRFAMNRVETVRKPLTLRASLLWIGLIGLAIVQFVVQLPLLARGEKYLTTLITIDDTYYYLQTAWNFKTLGFATFDGINPTNGVQFLWFVVLAAFSFLVNTKSEFLVLSIALCAFCNVLCYFVVVKIGGLLRSPLLALFMAALWSMQTFFVKEYLFAMENSLHALVFWCVVWVVIDFAQRLHAGETPPVWLLTIVLILNAWARLDAALFSLVLYIYCVGLWLHHTESAGRFWREQGRTVVGTALLAAGAFGVQLASFRWMGGSFLPVSALIKAGESGWGWHVEGGEQVVDYLALSIPPDILPADWPDAVLAGVGIGVLLVAAIVLRAYNRGALRGNLAHRTFAATWYGLLLGFVVYHIAILLSGADYQGYFTWYRSPLYIFWIVTFAFVLLAGCDWVQQWRPALPVTRGAVVAAIVFLLVASGWRYMHAETRQAAIPLHLYSARYDVAQWLSANSPPDTIFAAWNAGQLGYFSDRAVVNLDGLINSFAYYDTVLTGDTPLQTYLQETGVDYIVDYEDTPLTRSLPMVHEFPSADDDPLRMWHVP